MIILKILIGIVLYFALVSIICIFLKGATQLGNAYDERRKIEELMNANKDKEEWIFLFFHILEVYNFGYLW